MNKTSEIIPMEDRSPDLKALLFALAREVSRVIVKDRSLIMGEGQLLYLLGPWLLGPEITGSEQWRSLEVRLAAVNFDGRVMVDRIRQVLARDRHLRECCADMDILFVEILERFVFEKLLLAFLVKEKPAAAESAWISFEKLVYEQGAFKRYAYTHIFN